MKNLIITHLGSGEFDVYDADAHQRYLADARVERDGNEYDDPVNWIDVTVYDADGLKVEELEDDILDLLNDDFADEAYDLGLESDILRADFASYND